MCVKVMLAFTLCLGLVGCKGKYHGERADLCTEAANSIFDVSMMQAQCFEIEQDNQGRTLYVFYCVSMMAYERLYEGTSIIALLVCQKTEGGYVYYYPDINFIVGSWPVSFYYYVGASREEVMVTAFNTFLEEEIERLKLQNDWNNVFDESKCITQKVVTVRIDYDGNLIPSSLSREIMQQLAPDVRPNPHYFYRYLTSDDYGRHIYFCRAPDENSSYTNSYVVMINPDRSYAISEINSLWQYQEELKVFKEQNDWNRPLQ